MIAYLLAAAVPVLLVALGAATYLTAFGEDRDG